MLVVKGIYCELPLSHTLANVAAFKAQAGDSEEGGRFVCVGGGRGGKETGRGLRQHVSACTRCGPARKGDRQSREGETGSFRKLLLYVATIESA